MFRLRHLPTIAAAYIAIASGAVAQPLAGTGSITGDVRDVKGAAVTGARVEIVNSARAIRRTTDTDQHGAFSVIALEPAPGYTITISKAGFAVHEQQELEVLVGEVTNLGLTLQLSSTETKISVESGTAVVDQTKTEISQVVRSSQILNLPINGRRVDSYALLTPAVVPDGSLGLISFRGIAGGNSFLTDGNDTSNQYFEENAGRTRVFTQISQDAVQEFQVLSSGYSAAYGRAAGGIINTVTRSGTNSFNGTAYWFFRNRGLNARDPYGAINPPERRHQAGASVGGPIVKDRLFYFFNTEVHRRDFPVISSLARQPLFNTAGQFIGTCGFPATSAQCAAARNFLSHDFAVLPRTADSELLFGKLDWLPTQTNHISASFNYLRWISPNGFQTQAVLTDGSGVGANGNSSVRARWARLEWMYIPNGSRINEFRLGWFKDRHGDDINPALIPSTGLPQIIVEGQSNLGVSIDLPRVDPSENRWQFTDNFTIVKGGHSLRAGFDVLRTEDYVRYLRNRNGTYEYGSFTDFALDFSGNTAGDRNWLTYSQRFGNPIFDESVSDFSFFTEDQFRLSTKVTLHYGLRYEYTALPEPRQANPDYPESGRIRSVKTNFAPRFGFAAAFNRSRTVLRAGYGIFYGRYHTGLLTTFFEENGIGQQSVQFEQRFFSTLRNGPVFPNALPAPGNPANDPSVISAIDLTIPGKDFRNPYTHQGDVSIEHAISPDLNLTVSWLTSRALHLTTVRDLNIGPAGSPVIYDIDNDLGKKIGEWATPGYRLTNRVNAKWRRVNSVESGGNSYYNGLVVQLRKRVSHGVEGFLAYTWSHAIDFNQGGGADNIFFSDGPRSYQNGNYRGDKASSQLDQRHRLVVSSTWEPKLAHANSRTARALGTGWRLSQISTFASSQPATPTIVVTGVPFPGAAFNSTINGFGGSNRVPFLPPASLNIDAVLRTDARLAKIVPLSERIQLHLNFEVFNLLNHVSDTAVNTVAYQADGQVLRPVPGLGKGVASQGYPDGTNARRAQVSARFVW
ncbi:MAG TPA: carboxypeptidase regulatory-like domain-containing protein [Candidatus Solibacter sp.]|nr:carboxypeptidase regulatory-like domain-containing protein [Candidatus Solibacter sp.]